jgi:O-antigen/teichoic acid export membrane protein
MTSIKEKTLNGLGWSFADNIFSTGITFIVGLVLARILSPAEFGILGMIAVFIAISNSIIDSGFSTALIRKNDATNTDYSTVFFFNLLIGFMLFGVLYLSAPAISRFFKEPILIPITRVMGLALIINSFSIIQRTLLIKRVDFKTQTKISVIASLTSGIVGIGMALSNLGVWSLVGQQLTRQLLNSVLLWAFNTWRPVGVFSIKSFKELFGFGAKLLISGLIDTIYTNVYYLVIGKFYKADQLGQYTRAEHFNSLFSSNLTGIIQRVSFPVLSEIQNNEDILKQAYRRMIRTTMFVSFTCMLGLAAVAKPLVVVLIGSKWLTAGSYLQIICLAGMLYPLHAMNLNILKVKGRSDLFLKLEIVKKIIGTIPILLGIFIGIKVMLWGSVFVSVIAYFFNSFFSGRLIAYPVKNQINDIAPSFIISIIMAVSVYTLGLVITLPLLIQLILQIFVGIFIIVTICETVRFEDYLYLKRIVISGLEKVKK